MPIIDVLGYLKELEREIEPTQEFLYKLYGARTRLKNVIVKSQEEMKLLNNPTKYVASLKEGLKKDALEAAKDVMAGKLLEALRTNYEFDEPPYKKALSVVLKDNRTYHVTATGTGWNSLVKVKIDLNRTAGRAPDWGRAVRQARKALGIKVPRADNARAAEKAEAASRAWKKIFEGRGNSQSKFSKTIRTRIGLAAKPAPFWEILDKGALPLSSDRGGYPTPESTRTNFVREAQDAANAYMVSRLAKAKVRYEEVLLPYKGALEKAQASLLDLERGIEDIRLQVGTVQKIQSRLNLSKKDTDRDKLARAIVKIRQGLLTSGSVELTKSGAEKRTRKSVQLIARALLED